MGQSVDFFSGLNQQLENLNQQRNQNLSPGSQLQNEQLRKLEEQRIKSEMISNAIENYNPANPVSELIQEIASLDNRYIPVYVGAVQGDVRELKASNELLKKNQASDTFVQQLTDANLGQTANTIKAVNAGVAPAGLASKMLGLESQPKELNPGQKFRKENFTKLNDFTEKSLTDFSNSQDFDLSILRRSDEYIKKTIGAKNKDPLAVTMSEEERANIEDEFRTRLENHQFFIDNIEDKGSFKFDLFNIKELAAPERMKPNKRKEIEDVLKKAPQDFKDLLSVYSIAKFNLDVVQKLLSRKQVPENVKSILPGSTKKEIDNLRLQVLDLIEKNPKKANNMKKLFKEKTGEDL